MGHINSARAAKVAIVQPYVPAYRVAFFEGLRASLAEHDIELAVFADTPEGPQSGRNDAVQLPWIGQYREMRVPVGRHFLRLGTAYRNWKSCDAVVVGHLGSSLDTNLALALSSFRGIKVGVWGHIGSYVGRADALDSFIERWQLRRADHVFAYTPGGARLAVERGADPGRVTAVMNSIDTGALEAAVSAADDDRAALELLGIGDIDPLKAFCFIGGLDASKRIGFLAEALDHVWAEDPEVRIFVAGRGGDEGLLRRSVERGQTVMLGYADARVKAALGRLTRGVLMPGRVGLIAVDALVLGLPVLSTAWPYHAPESEYLTVGESLLESQDSPEAYAALIRAEASLPARRELRRDYPTLDGMVANFSAGILSLLER